MNNMEALLQVFVKVQNMEPICVMPNPVEFTPFELELLLTLCRFAPSRTPLVNGLEYKLVQVQNAMKRWRIDHE